MEFGLITLNNSNNVYCAALHTYIGNVTKSTTTGSTNLYSKNNITWSCCGSSNYNGKETVFWAIDNFYQIGSTGTVKSITVDNLARIVMKHKNKSYADAKAIVNDVISNNKNIYSVQQCVLWTLTNYHDQRSGFTNNMNILYDSLCAEAQNNRSYSGNGNYKPTITTTRAVVNKNGVIGPFSISGGPYTISAESKVGSSKVGNNLYKDKNCTNPISSTDNYNGDFYVKLNNTSFDAGTKYNVTINFSGNYLKTVDATYWTTTNKNINNPTYNPEGQGPQPLISFSKQATTYSKDFSGSYSENKEGNYSIKLQKQSTTGTGSGSATFNVKQYSSGATTVTSQKNPTISMGSGVTTLYSAKINNVKSDTYIITETNPPSGYKLGTYKELKIVVNKKLENLQYKFKSYNIYLDGTLVKTDATTSYSKGNIGITINSSTATITITFKNPPITGKYQTSFVKKSTQSTTNIDDVSDALPGAIFKVTHNMNGGSTNGGSTYNTNITTEEGKEVSSEHPITDITKKDIYEITEIEAPQGYLKSTVLNNCYVRLTVTKGTKDDKYIVTNVYAELVTKDLDYPIDSADLKENEVFEFTLADGSAIGGIRLKFTSEKIIVELSDPPVEPFEFTVQKKSAEDNQEFLQNTNMTIKRTVKAGNTIIDNSTLQDGPFEDGEAKLKHTENEIDTDYTYYYDIYENNAQSPYKNILGKNMFLRVTVEMDENAVLSATVEVKGINGYIPTQAEIDEIMKYVSEPVPNPETRIIPLIVKNPKDTVSVNLQLFKHQLDNKNSPVKDAEYSVKEIDENGNKINDLTNIKTDTVNKQIANIQEGDLGKSYYYEIIEETVPQNYVNKISGVRVKVEIDSEGKVSSSIIKIKQKDSEVWEDYNNTFERYVSISEPDENNDIILYMANSVKFDFTLYKKNYASNTNLVEAAKFNGTTTFKIEQIIGSQTVEKFSGPLANAQTDFNEQEASANTTYKYRITETYVSDDFYDTLVDIPIILNIRTDANGKVMDESYMGSNWYFEGEIGISESQRELMRNLVYLDIGANNQVSLYIANMPKNYYSLQLVKVDKDGNIINSRNAKFEVGMETNNPDGEGIDTEVKETKEGILNITSESGTIIDPGYTHTYTIKETEAPAGYTKLEGTIQLEAGFTDEGKLLKENISLKYINTEGTEETINGLSFEYDDESKIPTIQVYIPNDSEFFEFELVKEDLKGDKIEADELENGNIDGAHFYINRTNVSTVSDKSTNASGSGFFEGNVINDVLEDGTVNDIVPSFTNLVYTYQISEISSKSDYFNVFDGYTMYLTIITDDESKISDVDYIVIDTKHPANGNVTTTFKNLYGDFIILETNDTRDKVTIHIKNTYGYKVRLNKINTSGTPIEANLEAYLDAYNEEQNNYNLGGNRKCAINGIYNIPGTNETYTITGETTHLSEEYIIAGKKQIWTIVEKAAKTPYYNVFENRYIDVEVEMNEQYELVVNGYTIRNSETNEAVSQEELENLKQYIESIEFVMEGNVHVLNITLKNPARYRLKLTKYEADGQTELQGAVLTVNGEEVISNGKSYYEVDNITDIGKTISFSIQEKSTVKNHINILEGERKYLQISAKLLDDGQIILTNKSILEYNGENPNPIITPSYSEVFNYINITPGKDSDGVPVINVGILNPLIYEFEVTKVDTSPSENKNPLSNAKFEIYSPIVNEQNGIYKYDISKKGVTLISNSGKIYGVTTEEGKIAFEEKNMQVGKAYEYKITETDAPSEIYENIFKDYNIYVKVKIDTTNLLVLENYENGKNYEIRKEDGTKAPDSYYEYVTVNVDNSGDKASIKINIENPTKIKLKINKKIFGNEGINLANTKFEIVSEISGTKELNTDGEGNIVLDETPVKEGIYEYIIREKDVPSKDIINILSDNYIKFRLYVAADGSIYTVNTEGQRADNTYYLYKANDSKLELDDTNIDNYVSIDTTGKIDNISTVEIKILDPQKYNLTILKKDKDTNEPMNNITFDITVFEDGETDIEKEIKLKDANTMQEKNLTGLKTSNVNGQEGVISINDILFEKAGRYKLKLHETSPEGYIEIGDVEIYITIEVVDGKYELTNIYYEDEFIDEEDTKIIKEEGKDIINVQIAVTNEELKGSYDLIINKTDLDGIKLDGAEVKITVLRDNIESELYKATDDVTSKDVVIPTQAKIEDGTLEISDIRIEEPETYTIKIEEITAPEKYLKLEEPIEIRVTTKKEGEGVDARYVLESANLVNENELVKLESSEIELNVTIKNEQFDLALRKFITKTITNEGQENEKVQDITNRAPEVDTQYLRNGTDTTAIYNHTKEPISLFANDTVIYTIRVYNEADVAGYAEEVTDHLPEYLEFVNDDFNSKYGWLLDKSDTSLRTVRTNYLSREKDEKGNLIKAFNKETGEIDYKELQIKCKVKENTPVNIKLTNIAEISNYVGENGRVVTDRDSSAANVVLPADSELPGYKDDEISSGIEYIPGQQDDDDFEKVLIEEFDLALRKFITGVTTGVGTENEKKQEVTTRIPIFKIDENGNYVYEHTKEPVLVANQNVVEYTIRVYNEGTVNGYAKEIKDDIPEGLEFLPDDETNKEYRWVMLDQDGNRTDDVNKAKYITSDYLSKEQEKTPGENLLKAFDKESYESGSIKEPDYKEVKVAFKVTMPNTSDKIIINQAQISDDSDEDGNNVTDKDSTPNEWKGEDDEDIEKIKVLYFDLALRKWVTQAIVTENGQTQVTETGHKAEDDPEEVVKVDLKKSKLSNVIVKFRYSIRITNEGEIAGEAQEISDYIPQGLVFIPEDNPDWRQEEGKVVTEKLKGKTLQPGESAEVEILLTWVNSENNMGVMVNTAEISKDYNEYGSPDIDSTPNNKVPGEDDIDDAPVMLTIKTGSEIIMIVTLGLGVIAIIGAGIEIIRKKVIRN